MLIKDANTPEEYLAQLSEDRKKVIVKLRQVIGANLPLGFEETMIYGHIGFVVPKAIYPDGYHCDPESPLPFISVASQKNYIALYHFGIYADQSLMDWFVAEYPKHSETKLDMGKSCIRFKNIEKIPFDLIGELAQKMPLQRWIEVYESCVKQ